jgi:histone H1/5
MDAFSRQAIKKYVQSNNKVNASSQSIFDAQFNKAIKSGVEKEEFTQPKGKFSVQSLRAVFPPLHLTSSPIFLRFILSWSLMPI